MHRHIRHCITLLFTASLLTLAIFVLTPGTAFADSNAQSQEHSVSSFIPLGMYINTPSDDNSGGDLGINGGYQAPYGPYDNYGGYGGYGKPPSDAYIYGNPDYGNPYPNYNSTSINPNYTPQGNTTAFPGHHYGGQGLPFSGYSNTGNSPLRLPQQ